MKIECTDAGCEATNTLTAAQFNQTCYCKTLDRDELTHALMSDAASQNLLTTHPQLFSTIASFISRQDADFISESIAAIERVIALPAYHQEVLTHVHTHARFNPGTSGVFMGYDFHLGEARPQLIEINTNAGGAFLNTLLAGTQIACCESMEDAPSPEKLYTDFVAMFRHEWQLQRGNTALTRMAIVDEFPEQQFLYPEFLLAQRIFESHGIETIITAPDELIFDQGKLCYQGKPIDMVYNRLTDFTLSNPTNEPLNLAYQAGAVVVTPNPYHHALYADKGNLVLLSDEKTLRSVGAANDDITTIISTVPHTQRVTANNADLLWQQRKYLFFKPTSGFGGKATYRGDKLTRSVWKDVLQGNYIAQKKVVPGERGILIDCTPSALKMDVRAYTYQGKIQLFAARLYQGQTTNFRTHGGGFSPVFVIGKK